MKCVEGFAEQRMRGTAHLSERQMRCGYRGKRIEERGTKTRLRWQGSGDWEHPQRGVKKCM